MCSRGNEPGRHRAGVRARALACLVFAVLHLAVFAPRTAGEFGPVEELFRSQAERILDGDRPYGDVGFEYPPLAIPVLVVPASVTDDPDSFVEAFAWEMIAVDLAIVLMLALWVGRDRRQLWTALGVYTVALVVLDLRIRAGFDVEFGDFVLHRFDLVLAALVLAAALARQAARSATWSALLGIAAALKAVPLALFPAFARDEPRPRRALIAALLPLVAAAAIVVALGDQFWSAVSYHTSRDLQIETLGASVVLIADGFGIVGASPIHGGGSWNLGGTAADLLRITSIAAMLGCYLLVVRRLWAGETGPLEASVMVLAPLVVLAPILSPQFLIWLLPLSAAVYGLRAPNLVLVAACLITGVGLRGYRELPDLDWEFVDAQVARNALLLAYLWLVLAPLLRRDGAPSVRAGNAAAGGRAGALQADARWG